MKHGRDTADRIVIFALAFLVFALWASAAFAATFSQQSPAPNVTVMASPSVISVAVADTVPLRGNLTMKVDGQVKASTATYFTVAGHWEFDEETEEFYWIWPGTDYTHLIVSWTPGVLTDGVHTATVSMDGANGSTPFTYSWTFGVSKPRPTFSSASPVAGTTVSASPQTVSVAMASTTPLLGQFSMTIGGQQKAATVVYANSGGIYDYTHATVKCSPDVLGDGSQTATVTLVPSNGDAASSFAWTFRVAEKPKLGAVSPVAGSTVPVSRPAITVSASDNGTIVGSTVTVDGVVVPSTYDAAAHLVRATPAADLTDLSVHAAVASVTDAGGNSATTSWTFSTALPVTTFSNEYPAAGAVLDSAITTVQVDAACTSSLVDSSITHPLTKVTIDGVALPWDLSNPGGDPLRANVRAYPPASVSTDGLHTIAVTVGNALGTTSTKTWQVRVGIAPKLGAPTPALGAIVTTLTPTIEVPASDNSAVTAWSASINGVATPATYSGGVVHVTLPARLEDDATTTVTVSVADAAGLSRSLNWSFTTQVNPEMASQPGDCLACHAEHGYQTACGECHEPAAAPHVPYPHMGAPSEYHAAANVSACRPCHVSAITVEHARRKTHTGADITCATCHQSADPVIAGAIASGDTRCNTCHPNADHESLHETPVTPACTGTGCHTGTSLTSVHINSETTLTCETCHESTDPLVTAAITGHQRDCLACHGSGDPHGDLSEKHVASASSEWVQVHGKMYDWASEGGMDASCSQCHVTGLFEVHANNCAACHAASASVAVKAAITDHDTRCIACHPGQHVYQMSHEWIDYSDGCSNCHGTNYSCSSCHDASAPVWAPVTTSDAQPAYTGDATINLVATDGGTGSFGIRSTYISLDGDAPISATQLLIPEPVSGSQVHTLRFWSEDWSGHTETAHTVVLTVAHDALAPVTTSDITAGKTYAGNQTFSLTPVDDSAVTGTWWQLDGTAGAWTKSTTAQVAETLSGTVAHTLYWYSTDKNGNAEQVKSAGFSIVGGKDLSVTGANATFVVPTGVSAISVTMNGGAGGNSWQGGTRSPKPLGGLGGRVSAVIAVAPGSTLTVKVGGAGGEPAMQSNGGNAGWPNGGYGYGGNGGGGGSSSIWSGTTELAEAGGGGGGGFSYAGVSGGSQGTMPGGFATGGSGAYSPSSLRGGGGGGGWNAGLASVGGSSHGGVGGTSYIAVGAGTITSGINAGSGSVQIRYAATPVPVTLTYSAGAGGSITGASPQIIASGASGTAVTAVANTGYHFTTWSDGVATATRTDTNVTANKSVTANFAINTYTLTYAAGAGGTVSGASPQTVNYNASGTAVTAVANTGYHFVDWSDGVATATRTETNVTAIKSVTANFAINTYTLTYAAGAGGTLSGASSQTVNYNASGTAVTAVANTGYHFVDWSDGVATATRTDTNVTANKSVTANFAINVVEYTLTYTAAQNGTISGTSPQTVVAGASGSAVTAVADAGYHFVKWSDDSTVNPRADANVHANVSVVASFEVDAPGPPNTTTFSAVGADQSFTVPAGVTAIFVDLYGSQGGNGGGGGGRVQATLAVSPGQVLTVRVGDMGGWPNGGAGTPSGGAGGGSSSILLGSSVIAEAGGGGGYAGGSPNQPGAGGYAGSDPGGNAVGDDAWQQGWGAGGGGGWNAGGNGGGDDTSGDGGSSRVPSDPTAILSAGVQVGNGLVTVSW